MTVNTGKSVPPRVRTGGDLDGAMSKVEKSQQLAGHFPDSEALDSARRILPGDTTLEAVLAEIDARYALEDH